MGPAARLLSGWPGYFIVFRCGMCGAGRLSTGTLPFTIQGRQRDAAADLPLDLLDSLR